MRGDLEKESVEVGEYKTDPDRGPDPGPREAARERLAAEPLLRSPHHMPEAARTVAGADDSACL